MMPGLPTTTKQSNGQRLIIKLVVFAGVVSTAYLLYVRFGHFLTLAELAQREIELRNWQGRYPIFAGMAAIAVYVLVAGLSLPGALVLTLVCGWFFGFWYGLLIVSFGSTGGAVVAFLLSRYLFRDWIQSRLKDRLLKFNSALEREGAFYLFTLRLVPIFPFVVINAVMGLTNMRVLTFAWVSQIGMLPGTVAYVYAGASLPSLQLIANQGVVKVISWQLLVAFAAIGMLPLATKRILKLYRTPAQI